MRRIALVVAFASLTHALPAQVGGDGAAFEFWGGLATNSPALGLLGDTPGMNFGVLAFRWSRWLGEPRSAQHLPPWEVSVDVMPLARISPPLRSVPCSDGGTCVEARTRIPGAPLFPERSPFGIGVNAFGLTRRFASRHAISPSVGTTLGAILFEDRVPTTHAASLNFLLGVEAGVRLGDPRGRTAMLTYRALHLSNGGTKRENPGVFWHTISLGLRSPRDRRPPPSTDGR